ncbi:hypothetical protein B0H34DRAFT_857717 [Crassisporium funariophilum]|nr:hypothetical protein B0H34DRAFT_857717 [Crassisporium funariophilum]
MSSTEQTPASSEQQQQQQRVRKPPFADWPTIKILTPPQGRFSPKTDEWCFTYCSQSVSGRIHSKEPNCRSICVRKVFPHEVQNILSFKRHQVLGADGKAKYPLPKEGQSSNLPRILGGTSKNDSEDQSQSRATSSGSTKYWDEGCYLWTGKSRWAMLQKTDNMMLDLQKQQQAETMRERRKEVWHDYQEHLKHGAGDQSSEQPETNGKWWGPIIPSKPIPDTSSLSLLVPLPPDFPPIWEKINKLLAPSYQVLGILQESVSSGEQKQFAQRVWEKSKTGEPFVLAQRTFTRAYEQWKNRDVPEEDDGKKGST